MKLKTICTVVLLGTLWSCADNDMVQLNMAEPETLADYDYLKAYDVLRSYSSHIGVVMNADALTGGGMEYRIGVSNFAEVVPGTAFSHAKMVKANGTIDSTRIAKLVTAAETGNVTLIGTPLIWHKQQNSTYLNAQLSPNVTRPEGDDGGYCLKMTNTVAGGANDEQVAYTFAKTPRVEPGISYKVRMMVRGTAPGTIHLQAYSNGRSSLFSPAINVSTSWTKVEAITTIATGVKGLTSMLFCIGEYTGTLFVDDIELVEWNTVRDKQVGKNLNTVNTNLEDAEQTAKSLSAQTDANKSLEEVGCSSLGEGYDALATYVEKTDAEKRAVIRAEMKKYIVGVMRAAGNAVKDWIVVKEPLAQESGNASDFYWQRYLGDTLYAVEALKDAAGQSAAHLYIEESGLDGDLSKCKRFVDEVAAIERQGGRVDGLAVNIDAYVDSTDIGAVGEMFKMLAATGKLIRISDLNVTVKDATYKTITESQLKQQAQLYADILKAYNDNVPDSQRGGITIHQVLDGDTPNGLWNQSYSRKHAYGSVVEALK